MGLQYLPPLNAPDPEGPGGIVLGGPGGSWVGRLMGGWGRPALKGPLAAPPTIYPRPHNIIIMWEGYETGRTAQYDMEKWELYLEKLGDVIVWL